MSVPRAALARADLLLALALAADDQAAALRMASVLGFVPCPDRPPGPAPAALTTGIETNLGVGTVTDRPVPQATGQALQAGLVAVVARETIETFASQRLPASGQQLTPGQCQPRVPQGGPPWQPLVRPARLWPPLRASLSVQRAVGVDVQQLVRHVAGGRMPARLPMAWRGLWSGALWVLWDRSERMQPYEQDMLRLLQLVVRQRGSAGFRLWAVDGRPDQVLAGSGSGRSLLSHDAVPTPPAGTVVLLLSDLGALADEPQAGANWLAFVRGLGRADALPVAWAPLAPSQVGCAVAQSADVHCLQDGPALRRQRGRWSRSGQRRAEQQRLGELLDALMVRVSCCVQLEPAMLRALRLASPALRREPGLEGLLWTHQPQVGSSLRGRPLTPDAAARQRQRLAALPIEERIAVLATMHAVHAWRGRATEVVEASVWQAHAGLSPAALPAALATHLADSQAWLQALDSTMRSPAGQASEARGYARDVLARQGADAVWLRAESPRLAALWVATDSTVAPVGLNPADLLAARQARQPRTPQPWRLVQRGPWLWLCPQGQHVGGAVLADDLLANDVLVQRVGGEQHLRVLGGAPERLLALSAGALPCCVTVANARLSVDHVLRPHWAREWGRDRRGLYALTPPLGELQHRFDVPSEAAVDSRLPLMLSVAVERLARPETRVGAAKWQWGIDRAFGVFVELSLHGTTQRFRHLPPGEFWMGSPPDEPERYDDESPRHRVRITQGFWLADTACTQALWLAMMGDNPSGFKGDNQRSVDSVSWDDVQRFLQCLQPLLPPGCEAVLPTEAQWEYACRAGTETAFSLGAKISRATVNFDASGTSPLAEPGDESKTTVAVKSLPPNPWGLHEMHGNLWEWCADDWRDYAATAREDEALEDPRGPVLPEPDSHRALHGGSWFDDAGLARSAYRSRGQRGRRSQSLGFRLALRATSPVVPEGTGPAVRPGPEAPGPARQEVGPARSPRGRPRDALVPGRAAPAAKPPAKPRKS